MDYPEPQARPRPRSHQLVLPFAASERGHRPPVLPVATLRPRQVWASLGPTGQEQLRRLLVRIVREVAHDRSA